MKKKLTALAIIIAVGTMVACGGNKGEKIQSDKKPETTETTVEDAIGEDSEIQMTTEKPSEESSEEPTATTSDNTTSNDPSTEEATTAKPEETTTKKPTETTTKKPTETSKTEQTTEPTTTKGTEVTTEEPATTNDAYTSNTRGSVITITEFTSSTTAINKAKTIVSQIITSSMSDYECVKAIHDYLVKNVNYDYDGLTSGAVNSATHKSHSAEGALCDNLAVCDGYAKAFELLCAQAGIPAYMMYGTAGNDTDGWESHAWNVVKVAGQWYQIDCTWDDPLVNGLLVTDGSNITYKYFLLTDSEMYVDHILNDSQTPNKKTCTSTLFMGLGETLSLAAAMGEPGVIVKDSASFYQALTDYAGNSQWTCYIAVPQTETLTESDIKAAILAGVQVAGYNGYSCSFSYSNVGSYVVYKFTITVQ